MHFVGVKWMDTSVFLTKVRYFLNTPRIRKKAIPKFLLCCCGPSAAWESGVCLCRFFGRPFQAMGCSARNVSVTILECPRFKEGAQSGSFLANHAAGAPEARDQNTLVMRS